MKQVHDIYKIISEKIYLFIPDINKDFIIHADSSEYTIGAVLSQEKGVVDHYSKKLINSQLNYSIVEKEMFAIYMAINKWKSLIGGSKIIVYTDNKNLLGKSDDFNKKTNRWKASISDFNIEYRHIEGKENIIADELSRNQNFVTNNNLYERKYVILTRM
ncbi:Retrovirus-related Pol polyprotein from transposon 17.6 [Dictyocoela muelleri]|nr:Retrovirus-related Pol polyprotein from transposon 17.6 [Dictyocoela muelleri]